MSKGSRACSDIGWARYMYVLTDLVLYCRCHPSCYYYASCRRPREHHSANKACISGSMNPFSLDERDLLDVTERMRQARIPQISSTTTSTTANPDPNVHAHAHAQYFSTRPLSISPPLAPLHTAPNVSTVNTRSSFYPDLQARTPAHNYAHQHIPEGLSPDIFPTSPYEAAEIAAKEERRRRNTAASARFRQKKRQKEEALEHRMATVQERNAELEERVHQLELENKWLKDLVTEKNKRPASNYGDEPPLDEREHRRSSSGRATNGTGVRSVTSVTSPTDDGESSQ
ncbi:hypothetical protein PV04_10214 [Phialophora macrospora]|uniref:BZIP domain-containing protein n=1 Tax=Phialophora macrospora TaxID=1851006 RepID=A0A0D2FTH8_9EURO|nr:hypothetical protein PV04_10214 [Phialophora macrospora]